MNDFNNVIGFFTNLPGILWDLVVGLFSDMVDVIGNLFCVKNLGTKASLKRGLAMVLLK